MSKKILVIDDDKQIVNLISSILSDQNYEVVTASDGSEGLKKVEANIFNLIICDFNLPIISGAEFLKEIEKRGVKVPVIIISGFLNSIEIGKILKSEMVIQVLLKPFDPYGLLETVKRET